MVKPQIDSFSNSSGVGLDVVDSLIVCFPESVLGMVDVLIVEGSMRVKSWVELSETTRQMCIVSFNLQLALVEEFGTKEICVTRMLANI